MIIGAVKELGEGETRVALTPSGAKELIKYKHTVLVEKGAGERARITDAEYKAVGAKIVTREQAWKCDMMLQVNVSSSKDYKLFRKGQILFTYFHLPVADKKLTELLLEMNMVAIASETVERNGLLPLLKPTSQVAGRMAITMGAYYLAGHKGGRGKLLSGVPGVPGANVLIIGAGSVGRNATQMAMGMGAQVTVLSRDAQKLRRLEEIHHGNIRTVTSNEYNLRKELLDADIVVSAVLQKGERAPKIITTDMVKSMKKGAVIIDVAIDQGGSVATSKQTTHKDPIFEKYGVIHYCVANMSAAYPRTATFALTDATLPYILSIANNGLIKAIENDPGLGKGVNTMDGYITYKNIAITLHMGARYKSLSELMY